MGLDLVEFAMEVEDSLQLQIPDEDAQRITTPRLLVDYLQTRLTQGTEDYCLSQRAFHALRKAICARLPVARNAIRTRTMLHALLPARNREAV